MTLKELFEKHGPNVPVRLKEPVFSNSYNLLIGPIPNSPKHWAAACPAGELMLLGESDRWELYTPPRKPRELTIDICGNGMIQGHTNQGTPGQNETIRVREVLE